MADSYPADLIDAQWRLHRARAEYEALCATLPWSVEPMVGWPGAEHPHTGEITGGREDSPGYTPEQVAEVDRLEKLLQELSITRATHPYWWTVGAGERVAARMRLKSLPDVQSMDGS
ncbi:hypothetical protein [Streptomyces sp. NPDC127084]|uniref:hypothetical protein n=1 Tax=Streptomyces sp. NPDC127084 TaxID=3347133 RepID=UPI003655E35F